MSIPPISTPDATPSTEVPERPIRRTFTADYKRRILREADACTESGAKAALLRREGLYASRLTEWRGARDRGELGGATRRRGPVPGSSPDARDQRIVELERELAAVNRRGTRAEAMLDLQKKVASLLETLDDHAPSVRL